jgi:hypothetical protein
VKDKIGTVVSRPSELNPPPPNPSEDSDAPRFTKWPEQRAFTEVVKDKACDTVAVSMSLMVSDVTCHSCGSGPLTLHSPDLQGY